MTYLSHFPLIDSDFRVLSVDYQVKMSSNTSPEDAVKYAKIAEQAERYDDMAKVSILPAAKPA